MRIKSKNHKLDDNFFFIRDNFISQLDFNEYHLPFATNIDFNDLSIFPSIFRVSYIEYLLVCIILQDFIFEFYYNVTYIQNCENFNAL